jgi:hypothetical protein
MIEVPAVVRNKARAVGAEDWLERLPALVSSLEADWSIAVGHPYEGGTEAFVANATRADEQAAFLGQGVSVDLPEAPCYHQDPLANVLGLWPACSVCAPAISWNESRAAGGLLPGSHGMTCTDSTANGSGDPD